MKKVVSLAITISFFFSPNVFSQNTPDTISDRPLKGCSTIELGSGSATAEGTGYCGDCPFWPDGIVPYHFTNDVEPWQRNKMLEAMATLENMANIQFLDEAGNPQLIGISIYNSNENSSSEIGASIDVEIKIFNWNNQMVIIHELAHALGFFHEQSRQDRDNYIQVNYDNICPGKEHNFNKENIGVTSNIPYDFESILHYGPNAFSRCNDSSEDCSDGCSSGYANPTISVLAEYSQWQNTIGQRSYLSRSDELMFSFVYPFPNYRFFNIAYTGDQNEGTHIYKPYRSFSEEVISSTGIPENSIVWIMPGSYPDAEGLYDKPMTLRGPYGGVTLK